jgi:nucleolar pre-ribosomal-associated protein 1
VNRYLQSILQHPRFTDICSPSNTYLRDAVVALLHTLFHLHPTNTCQPSHVEPLIRIYRASMSRADRQLLAIFQLFEGQRGLSIGALCGQWSTSLGYSTTSTALDGLRSLESALVFRTCLSFPRTRTLDPDVDRHASPEEQRLYDPLFLMLLFSRALHSSLPDTALAWVDLFRTNVVSLLICALSAKHVELRVLALTELAALGKALEVGYAYLAVRQ